MSIPAIVGFTSTVAFASLAVGFSFTSAQKGVLQQNPIFYFTIGALLLFATLIIETILLITKEDALWQIRLAAMDLTFVVGLLILMISIVKQDKMFAQWKQLPQILLYLSWLMMLINIICNLIIFFSDPCE